MAGRQQPEPAEEGPFICEHCAEVWPTSRSLAGHKKAHSNKGKAPLVPVVPSVPPPAAFGPSPCMVPIVPPPYFLAPPVTMALGLGQPVASPGFFFGGGLPRVHVPVPVRVRPSAPPPGDPVVSGAGETIRMVLLHPNHAFWALYRMGIVDAPEELEFMGLRQPRRPESPSPSFESWFSDA